MKKLLVIAIALFTLNGMAQEKSEGSHDRKHHKRELRKDMSPKDIADLKSKKMTLRLDLTDAQQQKVYQIILNQATENQRLKKEHKNTDGEKKEKLSKEERLKLQNDKLDQMIAFKREMKTILNAEQYAKFEKMKPRKHKKRGKRRGKGKKKS